jgi:hypothetical protein
MTLFLDVAPYKLVEIYRRLRSVYCLHNKGDERPGDGGSKHRLNAGKFLADHLAQHPRRQHGDVRRYPNNG